MPRRYAEIGNRVTGMISARHHRSRGLPFRRRAALRASACIAATIAVAPCCAASVPLEVYGRLPALEDVALSADGTRIAFVSTAEDTRVVAVMALAGRKALGGVRIGEQKLRWLAWADSEHLLLETSTTTSPWGYVGQQREWHVLQVYDVAQRRLTTIPDPRRLNEAIPLIPISDHPMVRHIEGHTVLFVPALYAQRQPLHALIRVDLMSGQERVVLVGSAATQEWMVDAAGELVAEQDYDEERQQWILKLRRAGHLQPVLSGEAAIDTPHILGFGPNADTLLMQTIEDEQPVWRLVSLRDGTVSEPMAERKELDYPIQDHRTLRMIGGVRGGDDARFVFFDPTLQHRWDSVMGAFVGDRLRLVSWSDDFSKLVLLVDGAQHGYVYELVDLESHTATPVGDVYAGGASSLEVRRITYSAADGLRIPAYLTLPAGRAEKKLPLIVLPHGGPAGHDAAQFDWWAQALANQGYAVLQPNFRGSDLSRSLLAAGFGQWGRKMQTDLSDGVRYLAAEGIVDPKRVCIVGASYGGYAALAGVTLDPGVYRCAVAVAGITDLKRMLEWVNDKHFSRSNYEQRYWDRFMGARGPDDPALDEISPIKHIEALNVPVLLIHGRDDTVVPYEQSSVMADALRRANKDVQFVTLQHEDHWLSRSQTRLQMLQALVAFLRAHNPAD
jgi:dipeptidyl aminopeptidase/acylaminoacyl peptidase